MNSVYAFGGMLAAILLGITIGSYIAAFITDKLKNPISLIGGVVILAGVSSLFTIGIMKLIIMHVKLWEDVFWQATLVMFIKSVLVLILPSILHGGMFSIVSKLCVRGEGSLSSDTGRVYAVNTIGAALGSVVGAFVILPLFGLRIGIVVLASIEIAVGFYLAFRAGWFKRARILTAGAVVLTGLGYMVVLCQVPIEKTMLDIGDKMLFYRDSAESSVAVIKNKDGVFLLLVDGDIQVSSTESGQKHLRLLGHLPVMLNESPEKVLVVGLGSGITASAILKHSVDRVDIVELSPVIPEAARCFYLWNADVFSDPRINIIHDDGRNYLLTTTNYYDVVTTDPQDVNDAGMTSLYSKEYYELVRSRLRDGGVACQWIMPQVNMTDYKMLINTFISVFPDTLLWHGGFTTVLVGVKGRIMVPIDELKRRYEEPKIKDSLAQGGIKTVNDLVSLFVAGPNLVKETMGGGIINTDDKPVIEYSYTSEKWVMVRSMQDKSGARSGRDGGEGLFIGPMDRIPDDILVPPAE